MGDNIGRVPLADRGAKDTIKTIDHSCALQTTHHSLTRIVMHPLLNSERTSCELTDSLDSLTCVVYKCIDLYRQAAKKFD